jgi:aspartate oxidase
VVLLIENEENECFLSAACFWEMAIKISIKKIDRAFVQHMVSHYAGIEKTTAGLHTGLNELMQVYHQASALTHWTLEDWENNVLCQVGMMLFKDALAQTENKGVYFNLDLE